MAHHDAHSSQHDSEAQSLKVGYEVTDANTHQISLSSIAIFVTVGAGMLSMFLLINGFLRFPQELDRKPTAAEYERSLPPTPRLQVDQAGDLSTFREREEAAVTSWRRDSNSGAVRIPVDKAIEIVAARGILPGTRPAAAAAKPAAATAQAQGGAAARQ